MEHYDFILASLKTLKWRRKTKYYKQRLIPLCTTTWGSILRGIEEASNKHYMVNKADEVAELPQWLWLLIDNKHTITLRWGPYAFYNNFEAEPEAKYLMEMFKHRVLTAAAEAKVRNILKQYEPLIHINESFVEALLEREGCPNYWSSRPVIVGNELYQKIQERFKDGSCDMQRRKRNE